ncbi:hypothetical protein BGZ57DRAFT_889892, partial [Hyaloscypha finlandica]
MWEYIKLVFWGDLKRSAGLGLMLMILVSRRECRGGGGCHATSLSRFPRECRWIARCEIPVRKFTFHKLPLVVHESNLGIL